MLTANSLARDILLVACNLTVAVSLLAIEPNYGDIIGKVVLESDKTPVQGLLLFFFDGKAPRQAVTNKNGDFQLLKVPIGLWKIVNGGNYKTVPPPPCAAARNTLVGCDAYSAYTISKGLKEITFSPVYVKFKADARRRPVRGSLVASLHIVVRLVDQTDADDEEAGGTSCLGTAQSTNAKRVAVKVCSLPGALLSIYRLAKPSNASGTMDPVGAKRVNSFGSARVDLPASPPGEPDEQFLLAISKSGYHPNATVLSRSALIALTRRNSGLILGLSERDGRFEESTPQVPLEDPSRRTIFPAHLLEALPISRTRSFDQFALLSPGVFPSPQTLNDSGPGIAAGIGTAGQFSVNGLRSRENNFEVDGSDNNDETLGVRRQGFVNAANQSQDSLQEFQIISAFADARFGRNIGGQVNAVAQIGGLELHGSAYGFFTDRRLNARNFFDHGPSAQPGSTILLNGVSHSFRSAADGAPPFTRSDSGFVLGGPVLPRFMPQTFFSSAFEYHRSRASIQQHFNVPNLDQRGIGGTGSKGIQIGSTPLSPMSLSGNAIMSLYPFPNDPIGPYGGNTYTTLAPADKDGWTTSLKAERVFNAFAKRHTLIGRINYSHELSALPSTGDSLFSTLYPKFSSLDAVLSFTTNFSARLTNTFHASFGRTNGSFGRFSDSNLIPATNFPNDPYLLNAPVLINSTTPAVAGSIPEYVSPRSPGGQNILRNLVFFGVPANLIGTDFLTGALGQVSIAGFSSVGVDPTHFPQSRADRTFQWSDSFTAIWRKVTIMTGFDIRPVHLNSNVEQNVRPRAVFGGLRRSPDTMSGTYAARPFQFPNEILPAASLASAGVPSGLFQTLVYQPDYSLHLKNLEGGYFLQTQIRVSADFSLSLGVRFEIARLPQDESGHLLRGFDTSALRNQVAVTKRDRECAVDCAAILDALASQFPADFNSTFGSDQLRTDIRLGFGWRPALLPKLTIRGSFGTYSGQFPAIILSESRNLFPDFLSLNFSGPSVSDQPGFLWNPVNPYVDDTWNLKFISQKTLNVINIAGKNSGTSVQTAVNLIGLSTSTLAQHYPGIILSQAAAGIRSPRSIQNGFSLEYEINPQTVASLAYVGTLGRHLLRVSTPDLGLNRGEINYANFSSTGGVLPFLNATPLSPQTGQLRKLLPISRTLFEGTASSSYHSVQADLRRRYSSGIQFGSAFTYSHSIDDASDFFDLAGAFALPQNSVSRSERGSSNYDARLRLAVHLAWDIRDKKKWSNLQISGIYVAQTGQPYTVNTSIDANRDGNLTDRIDTVAYLIQQPSSDRHISLALQPGIDPTRLLAPDGADGRVGRNTFRAPGMSQLDLAISKRIPLSDRYAFILRAEVYNAMNWAQFGIPVRILESAAFGSSVNTVGSSRTVQIAARFAF